MRLKNARLVMLLAAAALASGGCARTVGIKGRVTLDGQPVEGASIQFVPLDGGRVAFGTTDQDGYYTLSAFKPGDGAPKGEYKVTVAKMSDNAMKVDPSDKKALEAQMAAIMKKSTTLRDTKNTKPSLPGIYSDPNTTPLLQTVPDSKGYNQELYSKLGAEGKLRK
ncbi:MAG TPA: carboxypeptidase-like regulatory domain-containing protein [Gemmataceae bacterium]|nr:carboxypeptidase-like regulatory domain-containing protein [Gemmataceae bacterium]